MRDFLERLAKGPGLATPALVGASVLLLTSLAFFRVALLPDFGAELGMSAVQLGAVTTVFGIGRLLADLPGGHLADRVGALRILGVSGMVVAAGSIGLGLAPAVVAVYLATFVLGVSSSVTNATGMTYFSTAGGIESRGTSMSIFSAALLGGQALGPSVAGVAASQWGWRATLVAGGVTAAAIGVAVLARSSSGPPPALHRSGPAAEATPGGAPSTRHLLTLQSVSFVMFLTLGAIPQTLVPVIGARELGLSTGTIGLALGLGGLSRVAGTLVGGRVSDRVSRRAAMIPALALMSGGVALLAPRATFGTWLAAIVLMSIASFAVPVAATILGDLTPSGRVGAQLGRFRFAGDIGAIVGPVVVTGIYDGFGRPAAVLFVAALLALVALLTARLLPETLRRR